MLNAWLKQKLYHWKTTRGLITLYATAVFWESWLRPTHLSKIYRSTRRFYIRTKFAQNLFIWWQELAMLFLLFKVNKLIRSTGNKTFFGDAQVTTLRLRYCRRQLLFSSLGKTPCLSWAPRCIYAPVNWNQRLSYPLRHAGNLIFATIKSPVPGDKQPVNVFVHVLSEQGTGNK